MSQGILDAFITKVIAESSFEEMDRTYLTNRVLARVGDGVLEVETDLDKLIDLKDQLVEEAVRLETIEDSQTAREILGAELMDLVTPCPSQVNRDFWATYAQSPEQAIEDFYQLSQKNDYIKLKAIAKNIAYRVPSDYGELEITINPVSYTHLDVYKRQTYVLSKYLCCSCSEKDCSRIWLEDHFGLEKSGRAVEGWIYSCLLYTSRCV